MILELFMACFICKNWNFPEFIFTFIPKNVHQNIFNLRNFYCHKNIKHPSGVYRYALGVSYNKKKFVKYFSAHWDLNNQNSQAHSMQITECIKNYVLILITIRGF